MDTLLSERSLSKLRWRCRRGLLENDLLIERFFNTYAHTLTEAQGQGMNTLMELADNDLLDLLLSRKEPGPELDLPEVREVLGMLKPVPPETTTGRPELSCSPSGGQTPQSGGPGGVNPFPPIPRTPEESI